MNPMMFFNPKIEIDGKFFKPAIRSLTSDERDELARFKEWAIAEADSQGYFQSARVSGQLRAARGDYFKDKGNEIDRAETAAKKQFGNSLEPYYRALLAARDAGAIEKEAGLQPLQTLFENARENGR